MRILPPPFHSLTRSDFCVFTGICTTATYLGDSLLTPRQIYKLVDSIYDTITLISTDDDDITHEKFVSVLLDKPMVTSLVKTIETPESQRSNNILTSPKEFCIPENEELSYGQTVSSTPQAVRQTVSYHTDSTSHMSSLLLTPLAKVKIGS